jgi:hypothetical protein
MNKFYAEGNATKDGEQKPYGDNKVLTRFSIAENYKGKNDEKLVNFWNVVIFKAVDIQKGKRYEVEGKIDIQKKDDKTYVNVIAFHVHDCQKDAEKEKDDSLPF